jgi:hypothetical protein
MPFRLPPWRRVFIFRRNWCFCQRPGTPDGALAAALQRLLGQAIEIATPFSDVTGTLLTVQSDYVAIRQADRSIVYIPFNKIQSYSPITQ